MSDARPRDLGIYGGNQSIGYEEAVRRQGTVIQVMNALRSVRESETALNAALQLLTATNFADIAAMHPIVPRRTRE